MGRGSRLRLPISAALLVALVAGSRAASAGPTAPPATVHVHVQVLDGDRPVGMFREEADAADGATWVLVCESPCDRELPLDANYRLDAEGIRATKPFQLAGRAGEHVVVTLHRSTTGAFTAGVVVVSLGVTGIVAGLGALAFAFFEVILDRRHPEAVNLGLAGLAGGGVLTAVGAVVLANSGHSSATTRASDPPPAVRPAAWKEPAAWPAPPAALIVPMWRAEF